jgi:SCY1-like protein 2
MFSSALKSFSSNIAQTYTLSAQPTSTAGAWKVFDGKSKKTGKTVSVFVFDRKALESGGGSFDNSRSSAATRRKVHDEIVERLKKEASSLARLRHPNILELAEPVEETRGGGLMFATEPITATLAGLLREQDNKDAGRARHTRYRRDEDGEQKEMELDELEIQKGLLQVSKGLEFLHESAGMVHGNLTPDAIYINQKSDWKLSALAFAGPPDSSNTATQSSAPPIALSELLYYDPRLPRAVQLDISYTSPDFVMDTNISSAADMFSLGLIMIALYNSPHESPLKTSNNLSSYKKLFSSSSTVPSTSNNFLSSKPLPRELKADVLPRLITRRAAQRMTAREFQESSFFDNVLVNTIRFLDSLPAKSANEKTQFLRGLPRVLEQFPKSVLQKKILPALLEETKDKELLSLILADTFKIIHLLPSPQRVVTDRVLPKLQEIFPPVSSKSTAPGATQERDTTKEAGLAVVLDNIGLVADTCTGKEFKDCEYSTQFAFDEANLN